MNKNSENLKRAAATMSLGVETSIPVTPVPNMPFGCSPMGIVAENAYLCTSPKELRALLRAVVKATKGQEHPVAVIRNIRVRLTSNGNIQIGSGDVFNPANVS